VGVEGSEVPGVEGAWRELRRRLADHLAEMEPRETLVVSAQVSGQVTGTQDGPGPYVMVSRARDADGWRLEAVSNAYLDSAHRLDDATEEVLRALGWSPPSYLPGEDADDGSANWHLDLSSREVERGAWLLVRTLREVYAVVHPAFLDSSTLDLHGLRASRPLPPRRVDAEQRRAAVDALPVVRPEGAEHLARLVRETVEALGEGADDDDDGDLLWPCGEGSLAFVHVDEERPAIHLFSVLVVDATLPESGQAALDLVSGRLPWLAVRLSEDRLVVHHELCAMPFVPQHLVGWLARLAVEIDDVAAEAAVLLGGRRMLDEDPAATCRPTAPEPASFDEQLAVVAELLVDGPVEPRVVAEVFGHDRGALVRRLVGLRQGRTAVLTDDLDGVLDALRAGLRWIVDEPERVAAARRRARRRVAPRPTVQSLLLDDEPDLFESDAG
jgi:hypothetical protein